MLVTIGSHPDINATALIELTGILKGTFSKTVAHLEELKMLERYHKPGNMRMNYFRLTEQGMQAYLGHFAYHERLSE